MMKFKTIIYLLFLVLSSQLSLSQEDAVYVCDVKFKNSEFNNSHAGSGFLLEYHGAIYGITAKHVLFFAKTDKMKSIGFGDELESWTLRSSPSASNSVKLGALINQNKEEAIEMPPKGDWLVFKTKGKIPKEAITYELRETPLKIGEEVHFLGFPYNTKKPVKVKGTFSRFTKEGNLSVDVPKGKYGGCSGGPVIDQNGKLVGIVSMGYFNQKLNKQIFEPASLDYFKEIMNSNPKG